MSQLTIQQAFELALRHHQAGQLQQAEYIYRQVLAQQPGHVDALHLLGVVSHQNGRNDIAVDLIRQAIAAAPDFPEAYSNLGVALKALGRLDDAIAAHRQALALKPFYIEAHYNLGVALKDKGQLNDAIASFRQAIDLKSDYHEAYNDLGSALYAIGQFDEAIAAYRMAVALNPKYSEALNNLGVVYSDKGQVDAAIASFRHAIAISPGFAEAYSNLGTALQSKGQIDDVIAAFRQAITLKPDHPEAYNNLGNALHSTGQLDAAVAAFRQALTLKPDYPEAHSNLVFTLHFHPAYDVQTVAEEHRRWNLRHAAALKRLTQPHGNDRSPERRLRIGYVSADLREHPVGRFLLPLLAHHDQAQVEIYVYAQVLVPDALTPRLRAHAAVWRSLVGLSDEKAADLIRQDQIDILVDLAGHTAHNRLLVFARKPAPVQVTCLGYPNSTGLSAMDYRLTDAYADPPGHTESQHTERLIRLAPCAWCYQPGAAPALAEGPAGPITFGCFNNLAKVTEPMLKVWGRILRAVPQSRLLLKAFGLGSASTRERVLGLFGQEGIAPERLEMRGYEPGYDGHLALYGRMDIALDTFPYHGTSTTCEALWMGVPVVSLAGSSHVSRVGVSLLSNSGLAELVAGTEDDYVRIAVDLAGDRPRLSHLRATLRQRMAHSPLMDAPRYARNVEAAYRDMWRQWCAPAPALR
jgi:predicted O-linked N-acetylglucosamine transferase (SPINDLY family)